MGPAGLLAARKPTSRALLQITVDASDTLHFISGELYVCDFSSLSYQLMPCM